MEEIEHVSRPGESRPSKVIVEIKARKEFIKADFLNTEQEFSGCEKWP